MPDETIRDVLARLDVQEAELTALRRRVMAPATPRTRQRFLGLTRPLHRAGRRRRAAAVMILALLTALVPLSLLAANPFTDLQPGGVHNDDIDLIYNARITQGCAPTLYCPTDVVRRDQIASFLARTAGLGPHPPVVNARTALTAGRIDKQANSATIPATSDNLPDTLVLRDANGDFAAGTITANLNGTATVAQTAGNAETVDGKSADELVRAALAEGGTVALTTAFRPLVMVNLSAPAGGFVLVSGTIYARATTAAGCPCVVEYQLRDTVSGATQIFYAIAVEATGESSGAATYVFPVAAGARSFAVDARRATGTATLESDADITALYVPFGADGTAGPGGPSRSGAGSGGGRPGKQRPPR